MKARHLVVALWIAALAQAHAAAGVRVEFVAAVPDSTPADAVVGVVGAHPALGAWTPPGLVLQRQGDRPLYIGSAEIEAGTLLEFKLVRGDWSGVEKGPSGEEVRNRSVRVGAEPMRVDLEVARWADGAAAVTSVVGDLRFERIASTILGNERTLRIWLPPGYSDEVNLTSRYPVLYMHDGQNLFDDRTSFSGEWRIDETLDAMIKSGEIDAIIVVGIDNMGEQRVSEYTFEPDPRLGLGGRGSEYARFLIDEVMPLVERKYRALPGAEHTAIGGSSLGGLVSLEIARRYPNEFGKVLAMSPSLWWADRKLVNEVKVDAREYLRTRLWIDMGSQEGATRVDDGSELVKLAEAFATALREAGVEHRHTTVDGAGHNEGAWSERFDDAIKYLFEKAP